MKTEEQNTIKPDARRIDACVKACAEFKDPAVIPELYALLKKGEDIISGLEADCDNAGINSEEARWWWTDVQRLIQRVEDSGEVESA